MKKKFNWKALIPLAFTIFAPQIAALTSAAGIVVAPAMISTAGLGFLIAVNLSGVLALIQPAMLLIAGFTANGSVRRGTAHLPTNWAGVVGAVVTLLAIFGITVSPELQHSIASFAAVVIAFLQQAKSPVSEI